ncbi:MBL fold metallo-hydrolase [Mycobacterium deserti]|uniref:MBL fold metallo-hydrolase n=1 Tax=Mycobacterium deserti TaxID=2978347 RepID=A0ABT2MDQ1_9MYCO|nr:MBL fold metallo-hydrolase [Mycobacterium deserti]MCT7660394.1 MBL fold metallo-hydrolase [Mycobacterium deserti]
MQVSVIETSGLGDRSYVVTSDGNAVVIDPQRDIDRVLAVVDERGASITHVLETHIHNDYVTGGLELSRASGAEYVVPAGDELGYRPRRVHDGDVIDAHAMSLGVIHTPGHTEHHVSYALRDAAGATAGVFTGGSLLFGSTGRTDLLGPEHTRSLTRAQFRSVRRLADELPGDAAVYPTHGFGSFCSAAPATGDASTIDEELRSNPALTKTEQAFVDELLDGLSDFPSYYAHMGVINANGPTAVDLSLPSPIDAAGLRRRIAAGEWVVDLRHRVAFAAGHLGGTLSFELSGSFVTYLGWLYDRAVPLTLIGEDEQQIVEARRELVRIGVDDVAGAAVGPITALSAAAPMRTYRVADFAALGREVADSSVHVLDVRQTDEFAENHVAGAVNVPLHELTDRADELPAGQIWVHCASGYRASIAASILDDRGRDVVLIDDEFEAAARVGLTTD